MRNKLAVIALSGVLVLAVLAVPLLSGPLSAKAQTETPTTETPRTLTINGVGAVMLTPDLATITIGVHTENRDASAAVDENTTQAQELISALRAAGVAAEDLQTSNFSIYPRQEYNNNGEITGVTYVVDNNVLVRVRDLDNIGALLGDAVDAGANSISGISFSVSDPAEAQEQALQAAFENARARAEVLAEAAGVELGDVQSINTYIGGSPSPIFRGVGGLAEMAADVPISSGQTEVSVDVTVVFEIR